jgi:hypothetical protein
MVHQSSALSTHEGAGHIFQGCIARQLVEKTRGWEEVSGQLWKNSGKATRLDEDERPRGPARNVTVDTQEGIARPVQKESSK